MSQTEAAAAAAPERRTSLAAASETSIVIGLRTLHRGSYNNDGDVCVEKYLLGLGRKFSFVLYVQMHARWPNKAFVDWWKNAVVEIGVSIKYVLISLRVGILFWRLEKLDIKITDAIWSMSSISTRPMNRIWYHYRVRIIFKRFCWYNVKSTVSL